MARVKMNAKHEYEFIANFKILQNTFRQHKIEKVCPLLPSTSRHAMLMFDSLYLWRSLSSARCSTWHRSLVRSPAGSSHRQIPRDNLEFLQWSKRFWDTNYGGQGYDPVARRRGAPTDTPATIAPLAPSRGSASNLHAGGSRAGGRTPLGGHRAGSTQPNEAVQNLQAQLREMNVHLEGLEKERDFYFAKVSLFDMSPLALGSLHSLCGCLWSPWVGHFVDVSGF